MTDIPLKTGKWFQDLVLDARERRDRRTDDRQSISDVRRNRMSCSAALRTFSQTQDWTGSMGVSPSGRFQVVEASQGKQRVFTREGIRWDVAWACLIATAILLSIILLVDLSGIGISMKSIQKLDRKIETVAASNDELQARLEYSSGDVSVCTEAVKRNLISSGGARTIRLTAPENANLTLTQTSGPEWNGVSGLVSGQAGD